MIVSQPADKLGDDAVGRQVGDVFNNHLKDELEAVLNFARSFGEGRVTHPALDALTRNVRRVGLSSPITLTYTSEPLACVS